jgi:hypothetical protein
VRALSNDLGTDCSQRLRSADRLGCEGELLLPSATGLTGGTDAGDALAGYALASDALAAELRRTVDAGGTRTVDGDRAEMGLERVGWTRRPNYRRARRSRRRAMRGMSVRRAQRTDVRANDHRAIDPAGRAQVVEAGVALRTGLRTDGGRSRAMWPDMGAEHRAINPGRRASESVWTSHAHLGADGGQCLWTADRLLSELLLPAAAWVAGGADAAGDALTGDALAGDALATDGRGTIEAAMYRTLRCTGSKWTNARRILNRMRASRRTLGTEHRALEAGSVAWQVVSRAGSELRADRRRSRRAARSEECALRTGVRGT